MTAPSHAHQLLVKATAILPVSDEDLIYKGIAVGVSERIITLKKSGARLQGKHGSLEELKRKIKREGISPGDHTLYTDLLEWQAIDHELAELLRILEALRRSGTKESLRSFYPTVPSAKSAFCGPRFAVLLAAPARWAHTRFPCPVVAGMAPRICLVRYPLDKV